MNVKKLVFVSLLAGSAAFADEFNSMSVGGASGMIGTPTAHTSWGGSDLALDVGTHYVDFGGHAVTSPKVGITAFGALDLFGAFHAYDNEYPHDIISLGAKFRFLPLKTSSKTGSSMAIGYFMGTFDEFAQHQIYLATSYGSDFFGMPALTTLTFGKSFGDWTADSDIDFSMGFDLDLFPDLFQGYVHWINDFGNYSHVNGFPQSGGAQGRGAYNTGVRIALLKEVKRFKLNLDALVIDALDDGRGYGIGLTFGTPIM